MKRETERGGSGEMLHKNSHLITSTSASAITTGYNVVLCVFIEFEEGAVL
jgi:hypothetical protein